MNGSVAFIVTERPRDLDAYESIYVASLDRLFYVRAIFTDGKPVMVASNERVLGAIDLDAPMERAEAPPSENTMGGAVWAALRAAPSTCDELAAVFETTDKRMNACLQHLKTKGRARLTDRKVGAAKLWEAV